MLHTTRTKVVSIECITKRNECNKPCILFTAKRTL